ncbi:hypothetical protein ACFL20_10055 [Spirochaetota bacterium]
MNKIPEPPIQYKITRSNNPPGSDYKESVTVEEGTTREEAQDLAEFFKKTGFIDSEGVLVKIKESGGLTGITIKRPGPQNGNISITKNNIFNIKPGNL